MPKKRFSEGPIAFALTQAEFGRPVGEICRKMGVAEAAFYRSTIGWTHLIRPGGTHKCDMRDGKPIRR